MSSHNFKVPKKGRLCAHSLL